jgi:hypothetical protein
LMLMCHLEKLSVVVASQKYNKRSASPMGRVMYGGIYLCEHQVLGQ